MKTAIGALLLPLLFLPLAQAAPVPVVLNIVLSPPEMSAAASYHDQFLLFNGTVVVEDPLNREFYVRLQPVITYPLGGTCSPDYIVFTGSGTVPFNCSVKVPAKSQSLDSVLFVNAQAHYHSDVIGTNQSQRVQITVGALPPATTPANDPLFGYSSSNVGMLPVIVLAVVLVAAVSAWAAARRRRRLRNEQANK